MPTYNINMRGSPAGAAWAEGANALAKAFTPDYEAQAKGQVMASQADANYARSAASLASRDKTLAETFAVNRENRILQDLDAQVAEGKLTPDEAFQLSVEAGIRLDPVNAATNAGQIGLGLTQFNPNITREEQDRAMIAAGTSPADTWAGVADARQNENMLAFEEMAAAQAQADADRAADAALAQWKLRNTPLSLSENQIAVVPEGHPAWTPENQGLIIGQRSVGRTEQILAPGGTEPVATGPGFTPTTEDRDLTTWQDGREKVTGFYDPTDPRSNEFGYVETSRGPLTTADGKELKSAADLAFEADDIASMETALAGGRGARAAANEVEQLMAMIKQGTPTGFWTNATMPLRQAAAGLNFGDEQKLAQIEQVTSGLGNRVMSRIQDTKGAVSNAEMSYFRKISASIGNSPAGNLMLLEGERRVHQRNAELRDLALSMRGSPAKEISAALEAYKRDNPIWAPEEIANIDLMVPDPELGYEIGVTGAGGSGAGGIEDLRNKYGGGG